eukprot:TRINITY_DN10586_c0_g1_i1.p1 TRINITY_DN10586_c0_g1~~TRINITY_DN10586_c0_g1_i1.p1  ORF type:complete len:289 (+),score=68.68 TRINITY_DN10586_c0_g1_i1:59-868(+)
MNPERVESGSSGKSGELVLRGGGWFGGLKKLDTKKYEYMASMINFDEAVTISNVTDLTKEISFYEYGPLLTLFELKEFVAKVVQKQPMLKAQEKEMFFFLFNIITLDPIKRSIDNSIMVFKYPYCFMLKFGTSEEIKFVIHLDHKVYYNLEAKTSTRYEESYYYKALSIWADLAKEREREFIQIQEYKGTRIMEDIISNQTTLVNELSTLSSAIESNLTAQIEKMAQYTDQRNKITDLLEKRDSIMTKTFSPSSGGAPSSESKRQINLG